MATETLPSGNYVADIRRAAGRWRLSLGTDKPKEARRRKAILSMLADTDEGREVLDLLRARQITIDAVVDALSPGGSGIGALKPTVVGMTIKQACDAYFAGVKGRASTRKAVGIVIGYLVRDFGATTPVSKVTKGQAQRWLYRKGWAPRTQQFKHVYAKAIFAEAKPHENVWDAVKPAKIVDKEMAILTREETHEFLTQLSPKLRAFMGCGFLAGMRIGEACNLRWQDVDAEASVLHIRNRGGARQWTTKSGKSRSIDVPRALIDALMEWRREKDSRCEYVFGMHLGPLAETTGAGWAREAYESVGMVAGRAQEGWTYHAGRHSAASNALRAGVPVAVVAKWLGNTVGVLLKTYSHVLESDTSAVANALRIGGRDG